MEYCFYSRQSQQRNQSFFVAISADQAFYVSPQLEPIVPVGGPMLLPRLHRIVFKSLGRRVVLFFFLKKIPFRRSAGGIPTCWKCEGMVARRFLGDQVLSYLHNMLLPETVGSNRDPLLAMSWFWWWLLAEEHPKSNLQLLFVTKFWKMLCEVYALRSQPPGAITVSPEGRVQAGRENFRTVVEQKLNNRNGQLQMVHLWLNQIKMRPFLSL